MAAAKNNHELAAIRRKEFAASCELLKVTRGIVLDYPDGKPHRQDLYRVVADVTLQVREFRPHVMLTFGPEGGVSGHTDHSLASLFATLAFHWAGRNNRYPDPLGGETAVHRTQKLYYATADFVLTGRQPVTLPLAKEDFWRSFRLGQNIVRKVGLVAGLVDGKFVRSTKSGRG
jgi:LmbE family N-acetylglucosaminyl deacetylase